MKSTQCRNRNLSSDKGALCLTGVTHFQRWGKRSLKGPTMLLTSWIIYLKCAHHYWLDAATWKITRKERGVGGLYSRPTRVAWEEKVLHNSGIQDKTKVQTRKYLNKTQFFKIFWDVLCQEGHLAKKKKSPAEGNRWKKNNKTYYFYASFVSLQLSVKKMPSCLKFRLLIS